MSARQVCAALLAAAGLAVPPMLLGAGPEWSEVRGEQFVLRSRAGLRDRDAIVCDVERVVRVLRPVGARVFPATHVVAIVVVDNERDERELLPQFWEHRGARPLGAYWSGLYGHHIVVRVDAKAQERFRRIAHEYAHFVTHVVYSNPPRWVDEGLSELLANATIVADEIEIGRPIAAHVKALRSGRNWIPLKELISASSLPASNDRVKLPLFYAESWALVHYLVFQKVTGILGIPASPSPDDVPTDEELKQYVRGQELRTVRMPTAHPKAVGCGGEKTVPQLSEIELLTLKAEALADGPRPAAALPLLLNALRLDPGNTEALETLGFVHFMGNNPTMAAAIFDRVLATGSASHISYFYRAVLADQVPARSDASGPVPVAEYLQRAVRLNPGFAPARERLQQLEEHP